MYRVFYARAACIANPATCEIRTLSTDPLVTENECCEGRTCVNANGTGLEGGDNKCQETGMVLAHWLTFGRAGVPTFRCRARGPSVDGQF